MKYRIISKKGKFEVERQVIRPVPGMLWGEDVLVWEQAEIFNTQKKALSYIKKAQIEEGVVIYES